MISPLRKSPLKRSGKPLKRTRIKPSTKPIPKVNARRQAKRKAGYRKMLAGKEYRSARAEAFKRAEGRCEFGFVWGRCSQREDLQAHHLSYPKTRPLSANDLRIVCKIHHEYLESLKPHKQRMF